MRWLQVFAIIANLLLLLIIINDDNGGGNYCCCILVRLCLTDFATEKKEKRSGNAPGKHPLERERAIPVWDWFCQANKIRILLDELIFSPVS